jgi:hypothetical protein
MSSKKMGILDVQLRPHLESITKYFQEGKAELLYLRTNIDNLSLADNPEIHRSARNDESKILREQGNVLFKAQEFSKAQRRYTESVAAAIEGPLASLAYSNRYKDQ